MTAVEFGLDVLNYGAIGLFCAYLIWQVERQQKREDLLIMKLETVITNNTVALTRFYNEVEQEKDIIEVAEKAITDTRERRRLQEERKNG